MSNNQDRSWTEIDLSNFCSNLKSLKSFLPENVKFMQIVKADAYGHGAFEIAKIAIEFGASLLGVANVQEAMLLRYQNIKIPILILSPSLESEIQTIIDYDIMPSISSLDFARKINTIASKLNEKVKIHINIDTGMGRSGFYFRKSLGFINEIRKFDNLIIDGIFSHYAASENDLEYSQLQKNRFRELIEKLNFKPNYIHLANSSAIINFPDEFCNLVRIGLLAFGIYSDKTIKEKIKLKPVMTFKTRISQIKKASAGDSIGYNRTFITQSNLSYAILPVGYADGYDFLLSNKGFVLLNNKICNVIGKISMDMIAIDIDNVPETQVGDEVILLGSGDEKISVENITSLYNGSPYEILCQIGRRAKRYYKQDKKIISTSPLLRRDFVSFDYSDKKLNNIIETAIEQRLQSKEIANIIYNNVLKQLFIEKDREIHYRKNFIHKIKFIDHSKSFFLAETTLTFQKKLQNNYFYVACANNEELLETYFLRNDVEYRWLLDENYNLNPDSFTVVSVKINDILLAHRTSIMEECIEIRCFHEKLNNLIGEEVEFSISTKTYYPKNTHQLTIFITEMTKDVQIEFYFPQTDKKVEVVPIFSGKMKFPEIEYCKDMIKISTKKNEWVFPNSGVVFIY